MLQFKTEGQRLCLHNQIRVPRKCLFKCLVNIPVPSFGNIQVPSFGQPIKCLKKSCQPISFFVWKKCIKNSFFLSLSMAPCRSQSLVWLRKNCMKYKWVCYPPVWCQPGWVRFQQGTLKEAHLDSSRRGCYTTFKPGVTLIWRHSM